MEPLKVIVIGAGGRGSRYTDIMGEFPARFKVVGVAEPIEARRDYIRQKHGVEPARCYDTWETILAEPKFADIAIISTMDRMHFAPADSACSDQTDANFLHRSALRNRVFYLSIVEFSSAHKSRFNRF